MSFKDRLAHAWNAFVGNNQQKPMLQYAPDVSSGSGWAPSSLARGTPSFMADKNIIENIVSRMSIDVSLLDFTHARVDENDTYLGEIKSGLNDCMRVEANIDQTGRAFIQDLTLTILNDGVACVVPVDTTISPRQSGGYDIKIIADMLDALCPGLCDALTQDGATEVLSAWREASGIDAGE